MLIIFECFEDDILENLRTEHRKKAWCWKLETWNLISGSCGGGFGWNKAVVSGNNFRNQEVGRQLLENREYMMLP